jgi:uncharacterized phage-like protein YoqJ
MKNKKCCFTGHRPKSLPWGYDETSADCYALKEKLFAEIQNAIQNGYDHFIIGMAQGIDTYAGEVLILCKRIYPHITIEAAIPCANQSDKWSRTAIMRYENILSWCDKKTIVSKTYTSTCMLNRNKYMVDNSSMLIAVWNGKSSGTGNTVRYAKSKNLTVVNLWNEIYKYRP